MLTAALLLAMAAPPGDFIAVGPEAARPSGRLIKLGADGAAEIAASDRVLVVPDAISLRRIGISIPPLPRGPVLLTTTGDRVPLQKLDSGSFVAGDDQTIRVRPAFSESAWEVPVSFATLVWMAKPPAETPVDPARYSWLPVERNRDFLRLRNGDTASGAFSGFKEAGLRLKPESGDERVVPFAELSTVAFNPALARNRKVKGPFARLVLRDGTRIALTQFTSDVQTLKGKSLFGPAVEVPLSELVSLDVMQGKAIYLADLKPKKAEQAGFLGTAWPWAANRTVRGEPLRLLDAAGESTFDRGLGTHPRTVLTYDLAGKYKRFEAVVGLDAATGARGRALVKVLVDGKEQPLPDLLKLTAGPAIPVNVSVAGAKELALIVDFGPAGDVQADVNWGDARLLE